MRVRLKFVRTPVRLAILATAAVLTLTGAVVAVARAATAPDFVSTVVATHSEKCLAVPSSAARSNGVGLRQETCSTGAAQRFEFTRGADGTYQIRVAASGFCVDVRGRTISDGTAMIQSSRCTQRFNLRSVAASPKSFMLVGSRGGKCADVLAGGQDEGVPVLQWTCGDPATAGSQIWRIDGVTSAAESSAPSAPPLATATAGPDPSAGATDSPPASASPTATTSTGPRAAGTNPDWGKAMPPADAPVSRAYALITGLKDKGYQPHGSECGWEIHARYWTWGPDGKVYPTWHPARDASGCSFGHEHGDDPRTSSLFAKTGWPAFGYTNEMLAPSDPAKQRDEDHVGHKVQARNNVEVHAGDNGEGNQTPTGAVTMTCDSLIKFHQGTHSPDALTNNLHELIYNAKCQYADNGAVIETRFSGLLPVGHPGGFTGTDCTGSGTTEHSNVGPVTPADSPDAGFAGRFIPDSTCAAAVISGQKQIFNMNEFWVTGVFGRSAQLKTFQIFPVFFVLNPSRYFDPNSPNKIGRQLDLCYQGATGFACDQVRRLNGGKPIAYDDPRSPFNGAQRDVSPGLFMVQNDGPTTLYTDVFGRRFSTTPFAGAIEQYIAGSHAGDRTQGTIRGTFNNYASNQADGVHAPN
jgi:hypothetical protein